MDKRDFPQIGDIWRFRYDSFFGESHYLLLAESLRENYNVLRLETGEMFKRDSLWIRTHCEKVA